MNFVARVQKNIFASILYQKSNCGNAAQYQEFAGWKMETFNIYIQINGNKIRKGEKNLQCIFNHM